jgi:hypothetical protein
MKRSFPRKEVSGELEDEVEIPTKLLRKAKLAVQCSKNAPSLPKFRNVEELVAYAVRQFLLKETVN